MLYSYLIRHFTDYEWPFEMFTEIFGLLKVNESTGSDKDEEVQRRSAEVYSENLRTTKLCHSNSSSMRVPASLWNQGGGVLLGGKMSVYQLWAAGRFDELQQLTAFPQWGAYILFLALSP